MDRMRNVEAGPGGVEYLAFGAGDDPTEAEMVPGWWSDQATCALSASEMSFAGLSAR